GRRGRGARGRARGGSGHARGAARGLASVPRDRREGAAGPGLPHAEGSRAGGGRAVSERRRIRHVLSLLRPYRARVVLMLLSLLLATGAALVPPYLAGRAIDEGIESGDAKALTVIVALFVLA